MNNNVWRHTLAYHLTWTTYGTWLSGDMPGWIKSGTHGIQSPDPDREDQARNLMVEEQVKLSPTQRAITERTIQDHCRIRNWRLRAVNARSNHIHAIVSADRDPVDVMNQLKAWCSRKLLDDAGLTNAVAAKAGRRHWFTEGGDKQLIHDEEYLRNAIRYVLEGQ